MIIGIEGLNSTGKTSLFKSLVHGSTGGVAEVSTMIPGTLSFPRTAAEAAANETFIASVEAARMRMAAAMLQPLGKTRVVMDRSVLSTLVISLANAQLNRWPKGSLPLLQSCLEKASRSGLLPRLILHLDAHAEAQSVRHGTRSNRLSADWTDPIAHQLQQDWYDRIYNYLQQHGLCRIARIDANGPAEAVHAQALSAIGNAAPAAPPAEAGFFTWLIHEAIGT